MSLSSKGYVATGRNHRGLVVSEWYPWLRFGLLFALTLGWPALQSMRAQSVQSVLRAVQERRWMQIGKERLIDEQATKRWQWRKAAWEADPNHSGEPFGEAAPEEREFTEDDLIKWPGDLPAFPSEGVPIPLKTAVKALEVARRSIGGSYIALTPTTDQLIRWTSPAPGVIGPVTEDNWRSKLKVIASTIDQYRCLTNWPVLTNQGKLSSFWYNSMDGSGSSTGGNVAGPGQNSGASLVYVIYEQGNDRTAPSNGGFSWNVQGTGYTYSASAGPSKQAGYLENNVIFCAGLSTPVGPTEWPTIAGAFPIASQIAAYKSLNVGNSTHRGRGSDMSDQLSLQFPAELPMDYFKKIALSTVGQPLQLGQMDVTVNSQFTQGSSSTGVNAYEAARTWLGLPSLNAPGTWKQVTDTSYVSAFGQGLLSEDPPRYLEGNPYSYKMPYVSDRGPVYPGSTSMSLSTFAFPAFTEFMPEKSRRLGVTPYALGSVEVRPTNNPLRIHLGRGKSDQNQVARLYMPMSGFGSPSVSASPREFDLVYETDRDEVIESLDPPLEVSGLAPGSFDYPPSAEFPAEEEAASGFATREDYLKAWHAPRLRQVRGGDILVDIDYPTSYRKVLKFYWASQASGPNPRGFFGISGNPFKTVVIYNPTAVGSDTGLAKDNHHQVIQDGTCTYWVEQSFPLDGNKVTKVRVYEGVVQLGTTASGGYKESFVTVTPEFPSGPADVSWELTHDFGGVITTVNAVCRPYGTPNDSEEPVFKSMDIQDSSGTRHIEWTYHNTPGGSIDYDKIKRIAYSGPQAWEMNGAQLDYDIDGFLAEEIRQAHGKEWKTIHSWDGNARKSESFLNGAKYSTVTQTYSSDLLKLTATNSGASSEYTFDGSTGNAPWTVKEVKQPGGWQETITTTPEGADTKVNVLSGWGAGHTAGTETNTVVNRFGGLKSNEVKTIDGANLARAQATTHTPWGTPKRIEGLRNDVTEFKFYGDEGPSSPAGNYGALYQSTDAFGKTTTVNSLDWLLRPTSTTTPDETITANYSNPLKTQVQSSAGYEAWSEFNTLGNLVEQGHNRGSGAEVSLTPGGGHMKVGSRQVGLDINNAGDVLGVDSGLGSRGASTAWSVVDGQLCLTTTHKTQDNGVHHQTKVYFDALGRMKKRESTGANGSLRTEGWAYSPDGLSVTYTPGPGPVLKPVTRTITDNGSSVTVKEGEVEVLKYVRQIDGDTVKQVTMLKDDSGGSGSQWVTLSTETNDAVSGETSYTPWDLTEAKVTQTITGNLRADSQVTTSQSGNTTVTTLTGGLPTAVSGTQGGVPFTLSNFTRQNGRLVSVSGQVASKNVSMGWDTDGRPNAMSGPGYNKSVLYGGGQGFQTTISDSVQGTTQVITASAVSDITGISGDGVPNLGVSTQDLAGGQQRTTISGYLSQTVAAGGEVLEKDYAGSLLDKTTEYTAEGHPTSTGVGPELMSVAYQANQRTFSRDGVNVTENFYQVGLRQSVSGPNDVRSFRYKRGQLAGESHDVGPWQGAELAWNQDLMGQCNGVGISGPASFSIGYSYDTAQRPLTVTGGGGASYIYAANGPLESMERGQVSSNSSVDALGRLRTRSHGGVTASDFEKVYTYDARNRIVSTGSASTSLTNLHYDNEDRLLSATLSNGTEVNYSYDGRGNRLSGSGPAVAYAVNDNNQLTSRTVGPAGRGYGVSGKVAPGSLVKVFHPGAPQGETVETDPTTGVYEKWWEDPGPGVTRVELLVRGTKPGAGDAGRDAVADKKVWVTLPLSSETYTYDGAGRLTEDATWWYNWNALGQLTSLLRKGNIGADANVASELISYSYDSDGRRTKRTRTVTYQDSTPTLTEISKVLWEKWHPVMEERTLNGSALPRRWFVWGRDVSGSIGGAGGIGGLVSITEEGGRTLLPLDDGLGNIIAVVDAATREVIARYDYGPFGEIVDETGEVGACPFRFQSKWWDADARLNYFGYRHYSPKTGRWLSRDPLGEAGGFNLYAYCGNDPVNKHDLLGLDEIEIDALGNIFYIVEEREQGIRAIHNLFWEPDVARHFIGTKVTPDAAQLSAQFGGLGVRISDLKAAAGASWVRHQSRMGLFEDYQIRAIGGIIDAARAGRYRSKNALAEAGGAVFDRVGDIAIGTGNILYRKDMRWNDSADNFPEFLSQLYGNPGAIHSGSDARRNWFPGWADATNELAPPYIGTGKAADYGQAALVLTPLGRSLFLKGGNVGRGLWSSRPPGVQVRKFGDWWVKRVNPESNALMRWWGQQSINAQYRGLQALDDMATPHAMRKGMLFTRSVGETLPDGYRLLNPLSRQAYIEGSRRMGTYFNDIQPRNMGTNGLIFDPAIDPITKALFWGGSGIAAYGGYKLSE